MKGRSKGKFKGKGRGGFKGGGFGDRSVPLGPILQEPPLYPPERMRDMLPAEFPVCRDDAELINKHRRLLHHWKTSPYFQEARHNSLRKEHDHDLELQKERIVAAGGVGQDYFPAELLLKSQLKIRGRASERSILDAFRRYESKEAKAQAKTTNQTTAKEGEAGEEQEGEGDNLSDEDIAGDDDDLAKHCQFEDGDMGGEDSGHDDDGGDAGADF
mmetsp:Transcript_62313/g.140397  ORF Transcript_62313/g.140397 Transcript_62313/m.140397 type:complete len:215 (-) Transcript_62313:135-779(-)